MKEKNNNHIISSKIKEEKNMDSLEYFNKTRFYRKWSRI